MKEGESTFAFHNPIREDYLLFQIEDRNKVSFVKSSGQYAGYTRPLATREDAMAFILGHSRVMGYIDEVEIVELPENTFNTQITLDREFNGKR